MKNAISIIFVCALSILVGACTLATPATRIAANPKVYEALPAQQQALVQNGQIAQGMSPEAVFLAWGYPNSSPYVGQIGNKQVVRWVYTTMRPVMVTPQWSGPYWGPYGWYNPYYDMPQTAYVPENTANVTFENGKVVTWSSRR